MRTYAPYAHYTYMRTVRICALYVYAHCTYKRTVRCRYTRTRDFGHAENRAAGRSKSGKTEKKGKEEAVLKGLLKEKQKIKM